MYVYTYMFTCMCADVRMCGGKTPTLVSSSITVYRIFWDDVLVNLDISKSDNLDGHWAPGVLFSSSPQHRDHRCWLSHLSLIRWCWGANPAFSCPRVFMFPSEPFLQLLWSLLSWFLSKVWNKGPSPLSFCMCTEAVVCLRKGERSSVLTPQDIYSWVSGGLCRSNWRLNQISRGEP